MFEHNLAPPPPGWSANPENSPLAVYRLPEVPKFRKIKKHSPKKGHIPGSCSKIKYQAGMKIPAFEPDL